MGVGGISIWQLLIVLVIVILLFGTKKLRNIGNDLGGAIKSFRKSMKEGGEAQEEKAQIENQSDQAMEEEATAAQKDKV